MKNILSARQVCSAIISMAFLLFTPQGFAAEINDAKQKPEAIRSYSAQQQAMDLKCMDCHESVLGIKTSPDNYHGNCDSCHTGGEQHRQALVKGEAGKGTIAFPQVKECLSCHQDEKKLMNWKFSEHNKAEGKCTDCHSIHASPATDKTTLGSNRIDKSSARCAKCHQDIASRFNMSAHHPLNEGAMSCSSCHDPHGSSNTALKTKNEQCLGCHQAVRGPMVFEHAPVVEDCMNCHDPHGSPNRRLLSVSQPMLCLQCHSIAQGKHGYGTSEPSAVGTRTITGAVLRSCTNCHSAIHGSHQDPVLRY
jgi:DmsE family decaheme c-type cytochrome